MQTFLPYQSFVHSAAALDNKRLGKQRVEAMQILRVLSGETQAWRNHPAVRMWSGFEHSLRAYFNIISFTWKCRGFQHNMGFFKDFEVEYPPWLTEEFCRSHQSNLIRKDPHYYRPIFGADIPPDLPYIWPEAVISITAINQIGVKPTTPK